MTRLTTLALCLTLIACSNGQPLLVRMDAPAGATLHIVERTGGGEIAPQHADVEARLPMVAELESGGGGLGYPIAIDMPADVSARYGGQGEIELRGRLYVYPPTRLVVGNEVPIPLADAREDVEQRIGRLVRGEVSTIEYFTVDPNERGTRYLVRVVLQASRQ